MLVVVSLALTMVSCFSKVERNEERRPESTVANFNDSSKGVEWNKSENVLIASGKENWANYTLPIESAGRYQFEILARSKSGGATVWMEDYLNNPDDRTYNITSNITIEPSESFEKYIITGSPLNRADHSMRLHISGNVEIADFSFTKMRDHEFGSKVMKQSMDGDEYVIAWADEFNNGSEPDTSKWTYDIGNWGWGNGELQYYTANRPKNARIEDGHLVIEAHKNDMNQEWTSARLTTRGKVSFLYGKIEFRAKVPPNKGNWAAGWTLGDEYVDELSWPYCGEIDILESVGYEMNNETGNGIAHASAHCGAYYFKLGNQPTGTISVQNMHEAFHTYAVEWTPNGMMASVDGQNYFEYKDTSTELSWPFDKPQNIILNLAMGGGWGGLEGMDSTITSQKFIVDYVRVYKKK